MRFGEWPKSKPTRRLPRGTVSCAVVESVATSMTATLSAAVLTTNRCRPSGSTATSIATIRKILRRNRHGKLRELDVVHGVDDRDRAVLVVADVRLGAVRGHRDGERLARSARRRARDAHGHGVAQMASVARIDLSLRVPDLVRRARERHRRAAGARGVRTYRSRRLTSRCD